MHGISTDKRAIDALTMRNYIIKPFAATPIYQERLEHELHLIESKGFDKVLIQVLDILKLTKDIPHIIRGSAANSLVCYLTGITFFDPIKFNLPLSRFMHEHREDLPDIDIDFPWKYHDEVFRRIYQTYGNKAYRISNHLHYDIRGAIREVIRRKGYRKFLPYNFEIKNIFPDQIENIQKEANELIGQHKGESLHCGGIVILDEEAPSEWILKPHQIKLNKDEAEKNGLIKIDLLSNRALAQLMDIDSRPIDSYPEEDEKTAELIRNGNTIGVGLAESPVFRRTLAGLKACCRNDMVLAMALIRPAAASKGRKGAFLEDWQINRKQNAIVFEDDAIQLIQDVLNCSEGEADLYRRAFAKKNIEKINEFMQRLGNHPDKKAIYEDLSIMNAYSFCKSHALSYGYLTWALAYQKAHNSKKFWFSALNNLNSMYRRWVHMQEAKMAGWNLTPGKPPWIISGNQLINCKKQMLLFDDGWQQYKKYGFWTSKRFMPDCFAEYNSDTVYFRGLIAAGRHYDDMTFITIGTASCKYLDLAISGFVDFRDKDIIEGEGKIYEKYNSSTVNVTWHQCCKI